MAVRLVNDVVASKFGFSAAEAIANEMYPGYFRPHHRRGVRSLKMSIRRTTNAGLAQSGAQSYELVPP